jgi:hypothetical protein
MDSDNDGLWRGEVTNELRHIAQAVCDLQRQTHELHCHMMDKLEAHRAYHAANEHPWGPACWCERHPFRFAALAGALFASLALGASGPALREALKLAMAALKG